MEEEKEEEKETYISPKETPIVKWSLMWETETLGQLLEDQKKALEDGDIKKALEICEEIKNEGNNLYKELYKLVPFCDPPWDDNYWEW